MQNHIRGKAAADQHRGGDEIIGMGSNPRTTRASLRQRDASRNPGRAGNGMDDRTPRRPGGS